MHFLPYLFFPWGLLLQGAAIVHFTRRRPDGFWIWIILLGGWLGALVYLLVEAAPDLELAGNVFRGIPRRQRISQLEAEVRLNPSAGNYEELGDLYFESGKFAKARSCFDKSISSRTDSIDPFYRRALCALEMGDFAAAVPDLERVIAAEPNYDLHRAPALLAYAYAQTGHPDKAAPLYARVVEVSTLTETQYHYAEFLASERRRDEARDWARRILMKKDAMPRFQRRRDRPWFRRTASLLKQLQTQP